MLSASIRSQLDRVSVVFTICSIRFLSVFEVVVFVFFFRDAFDSVLDAFLSASRWFVLFEIDFCFVALCPNPLVFPLLVLLLFFIQRHSLFAVCLSFGFPYPHTLTHFYLQLMLSCSLLFCYMRLFWEICVLPNNNHHERTDRSLHSLANRLARL